MAIDPIELQEDEQLCDLQRRGLRILQKRAGFRYGTDAVLLAAFAGIRRRDRVVDLGTGTGILPLLLYGREQTATFDGIEIQPEMADMARRSVALNGLSEVIQMHTMDFRDAPKCLGYGKATLVVCNPPYGRVSASLANPERSRALARHELDTTIEDVVKAASGLLKTGGRAAFVFPAQRMLDLTDAMRSCRLEPKRIRLVCDAPGKPPHLVLLEGIRLAGRQLHWLPPLYLRNTAGEATAELVAMYEDTELS